MPTWCTLWSVDCWQYAWDIWTYLFILVESFKMSPISRGVSKNDRKCLRPGYDILEHNKIILVSKIYLCSWSPKKLLDSSICGQNTVDFGKINRNWPTWYLKGPLPGQYWLNLLKKIALENMGSKFQVENVSETTQKSPKCLQFQGAAPPDPFLFLQVC